MIDMLVLKQQSLFVAMLNIKGDFCHARRGLCTCTPLLVSENPITFL